MNYALSMARGLSLYCVRKINKANYNNSVLILTVIVLALTILPSQTVQAADNNKMADLKTIVGQSLAEIGAKKGSPDLCVLTNAPYVRLGKQPAVQCLDMITEQTGCTQARGNLLFFHTAITGKLRLALFRKDTGQTAIITACSDAGGKALTSPCSPVAAKSSAKPFKVIKINLSQKNIVDPESYKNIMKTITPASNAFSIAGILSAWTLGAPYDFLKCCEFHNHYCPGVTIGYFIAKVMLEKYPLAKGQKYVWIGSPAKCGDDAIQILMDLTPGKRSCYIKELGPDQKKAISVEEPLNNVMGILVIWDNAQNKGKGVVFKYNWGRVCKLTGIKYSDFMPKGGYANPVFWTTRLKSNIAVIPYFDKPTEFVRVAKEVEVTPEMYVRMIGAGVNPYQTIGLTKP